MVCIETDDGLQQGSGHLIRECDQAQLPEIQMERVLQNGIDGRDQRLHHVVKKMAEADRGQNSEDGLLFYADLRLVCRRGRHNLSLPSCVRQSQRNSRGRFQR
jgi:hypothetical protein